MTKNGTPTPVYLDPGMHSGLEIKGLMLSQRRKRWNSIDPTLCECHVFSGVFFSEDRPGMQGQMLFENWAVVAGERPTLKQHWVNILRLLGWDSIHSLTFYSFPANLPIFSQHWFNVCCLLGLFNFRCVLLPQLHLIKLKLDLRT